MPIMHFVNCLALTFAPAVVVYRGTSLVDHNGKWLITAGVAGYLCTQLAKMVLLAALAPVASESAAFDTTQEAFKFVISFIDAAGIWLLMKQVTASPHVKNLGVGVGWAVADSFARRFVDFYYGAWAQEFSWEWIQLAMRANVDLLFYVTYAALVYQSMKVKHRRNAAGALLFALALAPVFVDFLAAMHMLPQLLGGDGWSALAAYAALVAAIAYPTQKAEQEHQAWYQGTKLR